MIYSVIFVNIFVQNFYIIILSFKTERSEQVRVDVETHEAHTVYGQP